MFRSLSKLAGAGAIALAGTLAPFSVDLGAGAQTDGPMPLMRLNTACAATADDTAADAVDLLLGPGCVLSVYYVCETSHGDHVGYRNR